MLGENPKNVCWNDGVKAAVERKGVAWNKVLGARNEVTKEKMYRELRNKERGIKGVYIRAKKVWKKGESGCT